MDFFKVWFLSEFLLILSLTILDEDLLIVRGSLRTSTSSNSKKARKYSTQLIIPTLRKNQSRVWIVHACGAVPETRPVREMKRHGSVSVLRPRVRWCASIIILMKVRMVDYVNHTRLKTAGDWGEGGSEAERPVCLSHTSFHFLFLLL